MRLAIIRQRYTPFGGAERAVENALEALLERDVAITLYTRAWPQTKLALIEPSIIDPFYLGSLWRDWGFQRGVCRAVSKARLDLVQSHERLCCCDIFRAGDGVHAVWLDERLRGASALARLRVRMNPHHRYLLSMEKRMFASPWLSAVICNSQMVRDEIRERFGVADSKLHVILNAVDSEAFTPADDGARAAARLRLALPAQATIYALVGSGFARKGVASAIRALATLPDSAHLLVVGADRAERSYAQLARTLGLHARVHMAGPQMEVTPYYAAANVFVLPTLYDPCPNAALEAMACGLPIVTSTKCGAAEIALAHDAGLVCDARDIDTLAAHLRALADPATCARMGA
ncbi:MAG: glycosyltransferase family 4 protein, partial [Casimicrobiaceae bacterium]